MNRKTIYIAGPMTNVPGNNIEQFHKAASRLDDEGWFVVSPTDFLSAFGTNPEGKLLDACMAAERAYIPHLDAIYLLRGWQNSKGAKAELAVALAHGLQVLVEEDE